MLERLLENSRVMYWFGVGSKSPPIRSNVFSLPALLLRPAQCHPRLDHPAASLPDARLRSGAAMRPLTQCLVLLLLLLPLRSGSLDSDLPLLRLCLVRKPDSPRR